MMKKLHILEHILRIRAHSGFTDLACLRLSGLAK